MAKKSMTDSNETTSPEITVNNIPAKGGAVPISGMETLVGEYIVKHAYLAVLEAEVEAMKIRFRDQAVRLWEEADADIKPKEYRFIGDSSTAVAVSMPDEAADSARKVVTDALIKSVLKLGVDATELGLLEVEESVVLSGDWLPMIRAIVKQYYTDRGVEVPTGLTEKATRKLVEGAFDKLRALRDSAQSEKEREAYSALLEGGKKSPIVRVG